MHLLVGRNQNECRISKLFVHLIGAVFWPRLNYAQTLEYGHAVAQAVNCQLPITAALV
jgi:hypothetical protein